MEILCLSNGHGEDEVGARIGRALQKLGHGVVALPLVGEGHSYRDIPLMAGVVQAMPTGGFVRMDVRQLWRDIRSGLLGLTWRQFRSLWRWSSRERLIVAVGDIVPLLFAWLCSWRGCPYVFVATAKSEYYWHDRGGAKLTGEFWGGSIFYPWERWLMGQPSCKAVFVRDELTANWLQRKFKLKVTCVGNPMLDELEPKGLDLPEKDSSWVVTILPGSRVPEAYQNFALLLELAENLRQSLETPITFLVALADSLDRDVLEQELQRQGWQGSAEFTKQNSKLLLLKGYFPDCLHLCHFGLAMAGTATEQLVGVGKPVFTLPGQGPQFTRQFAEEQTYLLGGAVTLLNHPGEVEKITDRILHDPDFFHSAVLVGRERMGTPGASDRIARMIDTLF
ncbi:MAG: lipid-A-disaccharide synthase-related protein [Pseudanabaenaceae cyanobacterium SKYGB_i_bin29]|nr:lipid-A-disaccharide synthase-related protein [Pseudanabaenaceae cyanobacterium SKYG29]MDW8421688.1 lipid-A-disaccharide synthase-related protein [Pseudanabaenaceae cyanobacterium SKYGB_i_bin29]